jgi:hypothetical protein
MILSMVFNGAAIDPIIQPDAITNTFRPLIPGYYYVEGYIWMSKHLYSLPSDRISEYLSRR